MKRSAIGTLLLAFALLAGVSALCRATKSFAGPTAMSRTITFITGPSRTADIELTLAIGLHGPRALYVIVIEETPDKDLEIGSTMSFLQEWQLRESKS